MTWAAVDDGNNWTGGSDGYAMADSETFGMAFDTSLVSPVVTFAADTVDFLLSFKLNYQNDQNNDVFDVDVSTDGTTWNNVQSYNDDVGGFKVLPGSAEIVTIPRSTLGAATSFQVRFRYRNLQIATPDWYVQVDDVRIVARSESLALSFARH